MTFHCSQSKDQVCNINDDRALHNLAHLPLQPNFVLFSSFFSIFQSQGTTFSSSKVPRSLQPWGLSTCCFFFSLHLPPSPNKPLKSLLVSAQTSAPQRSLPRPSPQITFTWSHCSLYLLSLYLDCFIITDLCDYLRAEVMPFLLTVTFPAHRLQRSYSTKICFERKGGRERFK